jgi:hypothetical protein
MFGGAFPIAVKGFSKGRLGDIKTGESLDVVEPMMVCKVGILGLDVLPV